jgi:hypothetical protein
MPGLDAGAVFLAALAIALATGLGAIPLLVGRVSGRQALGIANAAAAGVMLGASASLVVEGVDRSASRTALGVPWRSSSSRPFGFTHITSWSSGRCEETTP